MGARLPVAGCVSATFVHLIPMESSFRTTSRLLLATAMLAGCQSYQPVTYPAESHLPRDPHTEVRVTEKSGEQTRLVETRFENDSLVGRNFVTGDRRQAIASADIVNLEIGEPDTGSTVALVVGLAAGALLILFSLFAALARSS